MNQSYKALIKGYTAYLHTLGFADTTVYNFPRFVTSFLCYQEQQGVKHIKQITNQSVLGYFEHLQQSRGKRTGRTFSTAHLNRIFIAVDRFLEFLHYNGLKNVPSPTRYTLQHVPVKSIQVLTPNEIKQLYNAASYTYFHLGFAERQPRQMTTLVVLDLCYGCGLRRSEALNLQLNDVNFDKKILHVREGKNYKDRFVPMSPKIYERLQNYIYQHRRFFNIGRLSERSNYLYPYGGLFMSKTLKLLVRHTENEILQAKKPTLHTLRHSIATHLLQNGMEIENIATFLGHKTLESTKIYTHLTGSATNDTIYE